MKNSKTLAFAIVAVLFLSALAPAFATAVNYTDQPDATTGKDAHMRSGSADRNYGVTTTMDITSNGNRRSLIEFNLSSLPPNVVIDSAYLRLFVTSKGTGSPTVDIYGITQPWAEGTKNGQNVPADGATWDTYDGTNNWATAGGDFDSSIIWASTAVPTNNRWYTWDVTDLVKDWFDGSPNYGFLLRRNSSTGTTSFATSDNSNSSIWPILEINYILPYQFAWLSSEPWIEGNAGSSLDYSIGVTFTGDHTNTLLSEIEGSGISFIEADTTTIPEDETLHAETVYITWTFAPEIMQAPGVYEAIYTINSTENSTGENITINFIVNPYSNNVPTVTIDNDSSMNVSTSTPIVYVTVTDDAEQPSAYAEIIANIGARPTNLSYALLQNGVSTPMQFSALADGIYDYYARAYDNFSNAVNGENFTILIDTTKPTITNSSSMPLNTTVTNNTWVANFTVTDNFYLESVSIEINGTNYAPTQQGDSFTYEANLSLGNSTVNVYANDSLGNSESLLNGWILYALPPAVSEPQVAPPFGGSTKPGLLDSILAALQQQAPQSPPPTAQSPQPIPSPTSPVNPSPTPSPTPTGGTPTATGTAPTGAAIAAGTENEVQGDAVTGFVTLLRNVSVLTVVVLSLAMIGLAVWMRSRESF